MENRSSLVLFSSSSSCNHWFQCVGCFKTAIVLDETTTGERLVEVFRKCRLKRDHLNFIQSLWLCVFWKKIRAIRDIVNMPRRQVPNVLQFQLNGFIFGVSLKFVIINDLSV